MTKNILDELLPTNEKPEFERQEMKVIRYEDIKTKRVNGHRARILPGGRMVGKAIDRKLGRQVWTIIGYK